MVYMVRFDGVGGRDCLDSSWGIWFIRFGKSFFLDFGYLRVFLGLGVSFEY